MPFESSIATLTILILFAYALGSISTAILLGKYFGLGDPRQSGSKNPGATNMMRIGGKKVAALTVAGDLLKCTIPMWIGAALGFNNFEILLVGFFAFLGHLYPIYFNFNGGKGVASFFGLMLGYSPLALVLSSLAWLGGYVLTKTSAIGALAFMVTAPIVTYILGHSVYEAGVVSLVSFWSAIRHRENFKRLLSGKELRFDGKSGD